MIEVHLSVVHFDYSVSYLGKPEIDLTSIRLPVRNLYISAGYPGFGRDTAISSCLLVYRNVSRSVQTVLEYEIYTEHEARGFKPAYMVVDGPFSPSNETMFRFGISTVSEYLKAWVDWEIIAGSVHLDNVKLLFDRPLLADSEGG